ncbi:TolC family protein [Mucilaginibacter sp. X5P1]|uniref:TolC family protein n=1 Tax=Mucilaginibacter sp. X5P1 TaxID=2723088 RepID=UPI0016144091|nr:TolC family protein [Mucilaginibacter sp. X5P1]MBB6139115.1 outer membrane protein [Mucilaginibacter sp. X5P1]
MAQHILKFKKAILLGIMLTAIGFTANAQQVISLQKAVNLTLQRNLTIQQAQVTQSLAAQDVDQSKYNLLPSASANPTAGWGFGRSPVAGAYVYANQTIFNVNASAAVQVTLFQGGQLRNQIIENKLILDADKTSVEKVKNDLILNVVTDYLQILANMDLITAAKQQIGIANITLDRSQKSFNAGNQTLADLSQAKAGLSTAELNLTTAQNQYASSILTLKQYMEMSPDSNIVIEKPDVSHFNDIKTVFDADEVAKTAMGVNPDVHLAELQEKSYQQQIKIAKGNYYPTLALYGNLASYYSSAQDKFRITGLTTPVVQPIGVVSSTGDIVNSLQPVSNPIYGPYSFTRQFDDNFNQSVGISLQIPIFNHFTARTSVRKAKLNYEYAQISTQLARNTLTKTISQAVLDVESAEKTYLSAIQTYNANKEAFNIVQQRYNVGLVNSLDYNTSLTNFNKAETDMIQAKYTVIFRSKVIDYYLGIPITL